MEINIFDGIYSDANADYRTAYPINLIPTPKQTGVSAGYLKPADGIDLLAVTAGLDRGGIEWNGLCYRVIGNNLALIGASGEISILGSVEDDGLPVSLAYSFDRLAICSNKKLFYYFGGQLTQVTDSDIGQVNYITWLDGYFIGSDENNIFVTELSDPFLINPLKYGSAEIDPDPIYSVDKLEGELYAIGRFTIEAFQNVGGALFPFQRIPGALCTKGASGPKSFCAFEKTIVFVGGSKNEPLCVWETSNGQFNRISTVEIDKELNSIPENEKSIIYVEKKTGDGQKLLFIHLNKKTLVYDAAASAISNTSIWFVLSGDKKYYPARGFVYCYGKWIFGDPGQKRLGTFNKSHSKQYGQPINWQFNCTFPYNESMRVIVHEIEMVALTGRIELNKTPLISTEYSVDGVLWSQRKYKQIGTIGNRIKKISWLQQGSYRQSRQQRFTGNSDSYLSVSRINLKLEPLNHG